MQSTDTTEDVFGFGSIHVSAKEKLSHIKPSPPPEPLPDLTRVDAIAEYAGFVSREAPLAIPVTIPRGRPRGMEPSVALNMRAPTSVARAFQRWCEENRYSYPAALAEIMRRAGIPME